MGDPQTSPGPGRFRFLLLIGSAGILIAGLVGYGYIASVNLLEFQSPLLNTLREIELEALEVTHRLGAALAGVSSPPDASVFDHLNHAVAYLLTLSGRNPFPQTLLAGGGSVRSAKITRLGSLVSSLRLIQERFETGQPRYGQPEVLRAELAAVSAELFSLVAALRDEILTEDLSRSRSARALHWGFIGLACLLVAATGATLVDRENGRRRHMWELEEKNRTLSNELRLRQEAEQRSEESERLFRAVFDRSPVAIAVTRVRDGRLVDVNREFLAITGYRREEVLGRTSLEMGFWEDPGQREAAWQRLEQERTVENLEFRFRMKSGEQRIFTLSAAVVDLMGEPHIIAAARDVTETRRAEARMAWLASFPTLNPYPVAEVDEEGRVIYLNPTAERLFPQLAAQGARHEWLAPWEEIRRGLPRDTSGTLTREVLVDGRWYHQALLRAGEVRNVRIYALDITSRKLTEETLKTARDSLETWVNERTLQLCESNLRLQQEVEERLRTERSLIKHQEQLRRLSSALVQTEERERRRIATAIHDGVGQTLAAAKIQLDAVRAAVFDPQTVKQLAPVRDLLSEAIRETRTLTFELSLPLLYEIGLKPALEWLAEQFQRKYGLAVAISGQDGDDGLEVPKRVFLFQAARELCFNVVKHARARQAWVSLAREEEGSGVRLEVRDDGTGFDPRKRPLESEGGFGLFGIREQLRHYGGRLTLDTAPGAGTRIVIRIPDPSPARPAPEGGEG